MNNIEQKIQRLRSKLTTPDGHYTILITGLGSVGVYLLDYLVSMADPRMKIVVAGRNADKMQSDVNIIRTAATIRGCMRCKVEVDGSCNLENVDSIAAVLERHQPDFLVNTSRAYPGLKYGSISWSNFRAYGIWTPLSVKFARNIMLAYRKADAHAITINTSYSDAVIPWLRSAGLPYFDFGSGNLNHLIPRMKFYIADKFGIDNLNDIDVTLAVSHFHDVVISKEGQTEGQKILLDIKHCGKPLDFDAEQLFAACSIAMPVDQKRNMMNASSNFAIIKAILAAIDGGERVKVHTPGVGGEIGGYPFIIDCTASDAKAAIDESVFSLEDMRAANRESIYKDGILDVSDGKLRYTPELIEKVKEKFGVELPAVVDFSEIDNTAKLLIDSIITPAINS